MHADVHETLGVTNGYYAQQSRKKAGLTLNEAALKLSIGASTLYRYEQGNPPGDVIIKMAIVYKDRALLYCCIKNGIIWREALPTVEYESWSQTIASLIRTNKKLTDITPDLVELHDEGKRLSDNDKAVVRQMIAILTDVMIQTEE